MDNTKQTEIECPNCKHIFPLTQAFTKEIQEQLHNEYERKLQASISSLQKESEKEKEKLKEKIRSEVEIDLQDMGAQLEEAKKKNTKLQEKELELRKKQRALEDAASNLELELERKLADEKKNIERSVKQKIDEDYHLKIKDKDTELQSLKTQIDELRRKAEQGSQQGQGEVQEIALEEFLKRKFLHDDITPVAKGKKGADIIQTVKTSSGKVCGKIIWESKRTKAWGNDWVEKLKQDQLAEKADIAIIVSQILPENITHIGNLEDVWICSLAATEGVATMLRDQLLQVDKVRLQRAGASESMELVYQYLCGNDFKLHMENIVRSFVEMKTDLDKERNVFEKQWAKREKQINKVLMSTSQMYGDFQGIIGKALPEIKQLELGE